MTADSHRPDADPGTTPSGSTIRVLVLLTRDIGAHASGRSTVLRTHVRALAQLGHQVELAVVAPDAPVPGNWSRQFRVHHVPAPSTLRTAASAARALLTGRGSLNEALFVDPRVRREVRDLVARVRPHLLVIDSLRLSTAADLTDVPQVVDLDDLLSDRYADLRSTAREEPVGVLGFVGDRVPMPLRPLAGRLVAWLLAGEARRTRRREHDIARAAAAVSLVSWHESRELARRTGTPVWWLPPAVDLPTRSPTHVDGLLFLGGLDYLPNLRAVRWIRDEVLPHLDPTDPRHVLHVIGSSTPAQRAALDIPGIVVHGYVDDLTSALGRRLLLAPLGGGGIKLKVLDAMAHGVPVVGFAGAFEGTGMAERLRLQATDGPGMAALVRELVSDPARCEELGASCREMVAAEFVLDRAVERWAEVVDHLRPRTTA